MIIETLIGVCFFAGIVAILTVPWMAGVQQPVNPE